MEGELRKAEEEALKKRRVEEERRQLEEKHLAERKRLEEEQRKAEEAEALCQSGTLHCAYSDSVRVQSDCSSLTAPVRAL